MTDPGRPESDPSGAGREPEDPATSPASDWDPQPGGTSSAPGELADLVTPEAEPAPVWPAPGSVPPWSEPRSEPASVPPASDPWALDSPGSAPFGAVPSGSVAPGSVAPGSVAPGSVPPGAWTGPEGTAGAPTAYGAVAPDGSTPPVGWTPPAAAAAPAKGGINIGGWLIRGGVIAAIVVAGLVFRDRLTGDVTDLKVGDCFDAAGLDVEVADVPHQPCTDPHDAEVFFVGAYPDQATYPTEDDFDNFVVQQCFPAFQAYVGRSFEEEFELDIAWFYPVPAGWSSGDRGITCHVMRLDGGKITGSVKA